MGTTVQKVYRNLGELFIECAENTFQPPERLTVSQAAEKYRYLNNQGSYVGPWKNAEVPYMVEPMDELTSRDFDSMAFVGAAQSSKTDCLILNYALHSIRVNPMDIAIFNPTNTAARDFSFRRIDRLHRHSPEVGKMMVRRRDADNTFDKKYENGMLLTLSWPTVTEFAGKPIPHVALTDYDRMDDDIGGDGTPFDLATKRTTTFGSFAMTVAESSPSRPIENLMWIATSRHEAPPCKGILSLYNRGDRRRWYWPCPDCGEYFEGDWKHLKWKELPNHVDTSETVWMECPCCAFKILPDDRREMQEWGMWLKDGQTIENGKVVGEGARSNMASFWLKGVAARFTTWKKLVYTYLVATSEFEKTGDESALQKFYNTDLAEPYVPKMMDVDRTPEALMGRADDKMKMGEVPENGRMLAATVDVQKRGFVVQVYAVLPGEPYDLAIIDRFTINKSNRLDDDGDPWPCSPATYLEDWDLLIQHVVTRSYPLAGDPSRRMMIKVTGCDAYGRDGVTSNAYNFWRSGVKAKGYGGKFILIKGDPSPTAPRTLIDFPDSSDKRNAFAVARGDVPVLKLSSNKLKDVVAGRLENIVPGTGMIRIPKTMPDFVFSELCEEKRTTKGWENLLNRRNEAWDLTYYALGVLISQMVKIENVDWKNPPAWADVWDKNALVFKIEEEERFVSKPKVDYDFGKLAKALG